MNEKFQATSPDTCEPSDFSSTAIVYCWPDGVMKFIDFNLTGKSHICSECDTVSNINDKVLCWSCDSCGGGTATIAAQIVIR